MIEVLSKSENPKHRNSKFLRFLKKLGTGAYTIENDQLVKQPEKLLEFKKQEEARLFEEKSRPAPAMPEEEKMDKQKMFHASPCSRRAMFGGQQAQGNQGTRWWLPLLSSGLG
jgi:hypothetical protein